MVEMLTAFCPQKLANLILLQGYIEIGALLALDGQWQKLDTIRLLMGDEVSLRTRQAFEAGLELIKSKLDHSIENAKDENDFLVGVPTIVDVIQKGKILTHVYNKKKFHAKASIFLLWLMCRNSE